MALNKIILHGRFTSDVKITRTTGGSPIAKFCIAVDRDFKDKKTGERGVDFINCTAFNKTAEFVEKWFKKGSLAIVEGRLQIQKWSDDEGNNRYSTDVIVSNVYFGGSKNTQREDTDDSESGPIQTFDELEDFGDLPF